MNYKKIPIIILICTIFLHYYSFLYPGPRVASDFHFFYEENLKTHFDFPYLWSTKWGGGLGHYVNSLWAWPYEILFGVIGNLGINFDMIEKLFGILPILIIGSVGIYKLLGLYKFNGVSKAVAAIFYLCNSYILILIDGGQINLAIAYTVVPLSFYLYFKCLEKTNSLNLIYFTLSALLISFVDLRIVYLFFSGLFLYIVVNLISNKKIFEKTHKKFLTPILFSFVFLLSFNFYWILPLFFSREQVIPQNYGSTQQIESLSFSTLGNGLLLQQPHWYQNFFGVVGPLKVEFFLIPILAFLPLLLYSKDRRIIYWIILALLAIFLSKGTNLPFGGFYLFLSDYIPGFFIFRDPTKFYFLIALSYSVLIAATFDQINKSLEKKKLDIKPYYLLLVFVLYVSWINSPVWSLKMNGMFSPPINQSEIGSLNTRISSLGGFSRVLWVPRKLPLGFESPLHPAVDAIDLPQRRPFVVGIKGQYDFLNFLREAPFVGQLFDVMGVSGIAYPNLDYRREYSADQIKYHSVFLSQIINSSWVEGVDKESKVPFLKTKKHQERFFIADNTWAIVGSDDVYNEATRSSELNLSKNALIFLEESPNLGQRILESPNINIFLNKKSNIDLAATFIDSSNFIFPADSLGNDPDSSGFWKRDSKDFLWFRDFLQTKYGLDNQDFEFGGGWAISEGSNKLILDNNKVKKGEVLLARVYESTRSGKLSFLQDNVEIGKVDTLKEGNYFLWYEVGIINRDGELKIESEGDVNIINSIVSVDNNYWQSLKENASVIVSKNGKNKFDVGEVDNSPTEMSFRKINPTKYIVDIKKVDSHKMLVFSESYNSFWKLNDLTSIPVYSLLNGFVIEKPGQYVVEFSLQRYVYIGLMISFCALIILFLLWTYAFRKRDKK